MPGKDIMEGGWGGVDIPLYQTLIKVSYIFNLIVSLMVMVKFATFLNPMQHETKSSSLQKKFLLG